MTVTAPPPAVSVLIPAYQAEATLERAVLSALQQTVADVEVLVLDDGSTDRTRQVAERLAAQDARVRVLPSSANVGVAATRNRGLDAAQGTWVALLDADDAWLPGRLERLLAASGDVDVVCDDVLLLRGDDLARGEVVGVRVLPWLGLRLRQPRLLRLDEFVEHDLGYLKPMFRRRALDTRCLRYWPNLRVAEDFAFAVVALASGLSWRQVPEAHYATSGAAGPSARGSPRWLSSTSRCCSRCATCRRSRLCPAPCPYWSDTHGGLRRCWSTTICAPWSGRAPYRSCSSRSPADPTRSG